MRHTKPDMDIEKQLLIGLITSDNFVKRILPVFEYDYLDLETVRKMARWVVEYHQVYGKAPGLHIQDIFNEKKGRLKEEEADWMERFLVELDRRAEKSGGFNDEYLFRSCVKYFGKQKLRKNSEKVLDLLEADKQDQAERVWLDSVGIPEAGDLGIDPFDRNVVKKLFGREKERASLGLGIKSLDRMVGPVKTGWLGMFMGPMKRGKCVSEGSLVLLADGSLKPIEDVVKDKDKKVLSLNEKGKLFEGEITGYYESGKKYIYLVKSKSGREIILPGNDPLLTPAGWVEVSNLVQGEYVAVPKRYSFFGRESMVGSRLKLLSYLIAEGTLGSRGMLAFTNKESGIRLDFESIVINEMKDEISPLNDLITCKVIKRKDNYHAMTNTAVWLKQVGVKRVLSKYKEIPPIIFRLIKEDLSLFLSVLFTCDGSISLDKRDGVEISYSSASKILAYQVYHLLLCFGILSVIREKKRKKFISWELSIRDKKHILRFIDEIGFLFHKRKRQQKLLPIIESKKDGRGFLDILPPFVVKRIKREVDLFVHKKGGMTRKWWRQKPLRSLEQSLRTGCGLTNFSLNNLSEIVDSAYLKQLVASDVIWDKVVSVKPVSRRKTYDLTVRGAHNFIANDVIVHNTSMLLHMAVRAVTKGYNTVFLSLETEEVDNAMKIWSSVGSLASQNSELDFPYFGEDEKVMHETVSRPLLNMGNVLKAVKTFSRVMGGPKLRVKTFPMGTAGVDEFKKYLDLLEALLYFSPHVIIVDYLGNMKAPKGFSGRDVYNENSMALKALGQERDAIMFSAHQGSRATLEKVNMSPSDMPEDIRIFANVDALYGLLQTDKEKDEGIMRVNVLGHRHRKFTRMKQAKVLQQFGAGQFVLDDRIIDMPASKDLKKGEGLKDVEGEKQ